MRGAEQNALLFWQGSKRLVGLFLFRDGFLWRCDGDAVLQARDWLSEGLRFFQRQKELGVGSAKNDERVRFCLWPGAWAPTVVIALELYLKISPT